MRKDLKILAGILDKGMKTITDDELRALQEKWLGNSVKLTQQAAPARELVLTEEEKAFLKGKTNLQMTFYEDIVAMVFGMPRALFPAIATNWYGGSMREVATVLGLLSAGPAIGALISGVLSGWVHSVRYQGRAIVYAIVAWGVCIAAFGLVRYLPLALLLLALAGAADNISAVFRTTILQAATPDEYRGRLQGIFTVVVAGGPRLGDVEAGAVAALAGETFSVVSGGLACVVLALGLSRAKPSFKHYDSHHPVP